MQEFFTAVSNFGFPVVVAGYLLFRLEKKMEKLTEVIEKNTQATNTLIEIVNAWERRRR